MVLSGNRMMTLETTLNKMTEITGIDYNRVMYILREIRDIVVDTIGGSSTEYAYPWRDGNFKIGLGMYFDDEKFLDMMTTEMLLGMFHLLYRPTHYTPIGEIEVHANRARRSLVFNIKVFT